MAGKFSVMFELEMPNAREAGEKAGRDFSQGFSQGFDYSLNRSGGLATQNSDLSLLIRQLAGGGNIIRPPSEAPGPSGIQKLLNMGPLMPGIRGLRDVTGADLAKVQAMGGFGTPFKGLRDVTGADLAKVQAMGGFGTPFKGLRDVTGADVAKVQAMGEFGGSGVNWRQIMLGAAVSPFSPWIGARGIAGGLGGDAGGSAGGAGGGVGGALFGGNFSRFEAVFLAIHAAGMIFRKTLEELTQAMHRGFELFSRSAALRISTARLFQSQEIGKQMGLSPEQMENLMFRGQWGRARHSLQQFRGMEQMTGMPEVFRSAFDWSEKIAKQWEKISAELFTTNVMLIRAHTQIQTFFGSLGAQLSPEFRDMMQQLTKMDWAGAGTAIGQFLKPLGLFFESIKGLAMLMEKVANLPGVKQMSKMVGIMTGTSSFGDMNKLYARIFGEDAPFKKTDATSVFSRQLPTMSHFEKMGFVFGGISTAEYLKQTADHTAQMAADLRLLVQRQMGGDAHGSPYPGASGGFINVP